MRVVPSSEKPGDLDVPLIQLQSELLVAVHGGTMGRELLACEERFQRAEQRALRFLVHVKSSALS